jgi:hypothetical protein
MRFAMWVGLALLFPGFPLAHAQSPMIQGWVASNAVCKNVSGDDLKTKQACETRDRLGAKLKRRGCEYQEDGDWWRCKH